MSSDSKILTAPRMVTGKLSKRVSYLKLPTAFTALIPEGKAFIMS